MTFTTKNTTYRLQDMGDGAFTIVGHHRYCPSPVTVTLPYGVPTVGHSFHFQYVVPRFNHSSPDIVTTTRVQSVQGRL